MFRSLHIAATGMAAQETQLEGVANNIANANTTGFKRQRIEFQDLLYQTVRGPGTSTSETTRSPTGIQLGSGVRVAGTSRNFSQGNILELMIVLILIFELAFALPRHAGFLIAIRSPGGRTVAGCSPFPRMRGTFP